MKRGVAPRAGVRSTRTIRVPVTPAEYARIRARAREENKSVAAFMREAADDKLETELLGQDEDWHE